MKILVTGGLGFIGSNLVRYLGNDVNDVIVQDNMFNVAADPVGKVLIRSVSEGCGEMRGVDAVIHLAALPGVYDCQMRPTSAMDTNCFGTMRMIEEARVNGVKKFILASSVGAVLGVRPQPVNEDQSPHPQTVYGWSKYIAEQYALTHSGDMKTIVLRFTNVYGEYCRNKTSVIPKLLKRRKDVPFIIYGDGQQTRDFIYVGDICRAIGKALSSDAEGIYHIGSGKGVSLLRLIGLVEDIIGEDIPVKYRGARDGDVKDNYADISKAKELLNWQTETGLLNGIEKTWEYVKCAVS